MNFLKVALALSIFTLSALLFRTQSRRRKLSISSILWFNNYYCNKIQNCRTNDAN